MIHSCSTISRSGLLACLLACLLPGLLCGVLGTVEAVAAPAKRRPAVQRVVMIAPVSDREASFRTLQAVRGQLSDVSAKLEVHAVDQLDPSPASQLSSARAVARLKKAAVVFWFHAKRARVSIYLHAANGGRLVERPVKSAGSEGQYEALAVIVRFAVRGHLQGEKVGVRLPPLRPRPVVKPPPVRPPTVRPSPPVDRAQRLSLETGYALDLYSDQLTAAQGLRVAAVVHLHRQWSIFVGFRMEAPLDTESEAAALTLRRYPVDLGARFLWRRDRFALGAQVSLSVAATTARTLSLDDDDGQVQDVPAHAAVALTPALVLGVRLWRRLALVLTLGARIHLNQTDYRVDSEPQPVLAPWRVQPTLSLALHVPLF